MSSYGNTQLLSPATYRQMRNERDKSPEFGPHSAAIKFTKPLIKGFWARRVNVDLVVPPEPVSNRAAKGLVEVAFYDFEDDKGESPVWPGTLRRGIWTPEEEIILPGTPPVDELFVLPGVSEEQVVELVLNVPQDRVAAVTEAFRRLKDAPRPPSES